MQEQGRPLIDHILTLLDSLRASGLTLGQLGEAGPAEAFSGLDGQSLQTACEIINFMDEMPGGFLIYRADGEEEILYANRGLLRILQCADMAEFREMTGGSFRGMVFPEDLEAVEKSILHQVAASRHDLDYVEYRVVRRDGAVRWIEDYGHYVYTESVGGVFYVFLADATEKKEKLLTERALLVHEKERNQRELKALMEAYGRERSKIDQEHLRQLEVIEGLGINYESIFYVDLDKDAVLPYRLSHRSDAIFGARLQVSPYAASMAAYIDQWVCPEDREAVVRASAPDTIRARLAGSSSCYVNYRTAGSRTQYLQMRFVAVGQTERVAQLVMGCRRVDDEIRREMEQKQLLEEALNNAQLSITAKNTFLSNMSHDMRTPLNAIFGFTALAKSSLPDVRAARGYLERIESSSRQLLDMIDKVLQLSWMDSNEAQAEESDCSLREILEEVRDFLLPQAAEKDIAFTLDCSQVRHDAVRGDREKLGQLVMYLANNAVTYTPAGGSVSITAMEAEELLHSFAVYKIEVRDTGVGISESFLKQIFEPFTRERNTTLSGVHGVGLGLTIAKNITELLGGAIEVQSAVDKGSAFTVTLRLRFRPQGTPEPDAAAPQPERSGCRRILLVEDNEINLEIETEILTGLGFSVETAVNGAAAVEMVRDAAPGAYDLILMDIQMPVLDGWQATRAIRALPDKALANIPIVALSANVFDSDIRKSREAGMDGHLAKPIDVPLLLETIDRIMSGPDR